jgi:hypothetical protein
MWAIFIHLGQPNLSLNCWVAGIRTPIKGFKGLCPTIRRHPNTVTACSLKLFQPKNKLLAAENLYEREFERQRIYCRIALLRGCIEQNDERV